MFPATAEQRCWFRVSGNVLAALTKSAHPGAKAALAEIYNAEDRKHALKVAKVFQDLYAAKWPKAVAKITDQLDVLLACYDFPAEHWIHLRTTNPIWVGVFKCRSRRCFPDRCSPWVALTLNAIWRR